VIVLSYILFPFVALILVYTFLSSAHSASYAHAVSPYNHYKGAIANKIELVHCEGETFILNPPRPPPPRTTPTHPSQSCNILGSAGPTSPKNEIKWKLRHDRHTVTPIFPRDVVKCISQAGLCHTQVSQMT